MRRGLRLRWRLFIRSVLAATAATPNRKLSLVFADFSERAGLLFVAKDHHFFEEQGVDVDVVQVRNGPVAIAAVAAGEAQFYSVSATGASLGAMAGGLDIVFVAGFINRLDGYFAVSTKVRAPEDLKGRLSVSKASAAASGCLRKSCSITGA